MRKMTCQLRWEKSHQVPTLDKQLQITAVQRGTVSLAYMSPIMGYPIQVANHKHIDIWCRRVFCLYVTFIDQIKRLPWPFDRIAA